MLAIFSELGPILAGHLRWLEVESAEIWRDWRVVTAQLGAVLGEQLTASNFAAPEFLDAEGKSRKTDGRSSQVSDNRIRDQRFRAGLRRRTKKAKAGRGESKPQHQNGFT
jgi:hypothetical protein